LAGFFAAAFFAGFFAAFFFAAILGLSRKSECCASVAADAVPTVKR